MKLNESMYIVCMKNRSQKEDYRINKKNDTSVLIYCFIQKKKYGKYSVY